MPTIETDDRRIDLEDADRAVLDARIRNARAGAREIAAETGIVANRVDDRLSRLEDAGAIRGYSARVDYDRLGYDVTTIVRLSTDDDDVLEELAADPRFVTVYAVTGTDDVLGIAKFTDTDEMDTAVSNLLTDDRITDIRTDLVLDVHREFEPFTPPE